jgi:exonuclease SbcC
VRDKVEEILGFTAEQFSQVVVLPQGEFRKLLLASSGDKEKILEKLFATERFKRIENLLKDRRDALYKKLEGIRNTVRGILEGQEVEAPDQLVAKADLLQQQEVVLMERSATAAASQQQAAEALQEGHLAAEKFTRLERAKGEVAVLDGEREAMAVLGSRAERGRRALSLLDLDEALARDRRQQNELTRQIDLLGDELMRLNNELSAASVEHDQLRLRAETIPARTAEKGALEARLRLIDELVSVEQLLLAAGQQRAAASAAHVKLQAGIVKTESELADAGRKIEELTVAAGRRGELEQRLKEADLQATARQNLAASVSRAEKLATERDVLVTGCAEAAAVLTQATEAHDGLARQLIQGQAARLARELADGTPCPVCGSTEHPLPASGGEEVPTEQELAVARRTVDSARTAGEQATASLARHDICTGEARAAIAALRHQLGGQADAPLEVILAARAVLNSDLERVTIKENELVKGKKRRDELTGLLEEGKKKREAAAQFLQEVVSREDTLTGQQQSKLKELEGAQRDQGAIRGQIVALDRFIADTQARLKVVEERTVSLRQGVNMRQGKREESGRAAGELDERLKQAQASFSARLAQAAFTSEEEFRCARISAEDLRQAEHELSAFQEKVTAATAGLSQAESACSGLIKPDIETLAAQRAAADADVTALSAERGAMANQLAGTRQAMASIEAYRNESEEQEHRLAIVGNLANLAAGNNPKRITLQRFVLASLFEEVALAASERLSRMSRGRYHLRRSEAVEDGRKGAGLDLEVTDDFTGQHRPASTLSGGETFLASLSLALGLSDVVLAQSGGRYLETLFIDEGFGTLDSETLDIAMDTLIRLNEQGRMVGIISHVSELKEQIPRQLQVISGRNGSRVALVN